MTPSVDTLLERALEARRRVVRDYSTARICGALAAAAAHWSSADSPERRALSVRLAPRIRLDAGMIDVGLRKIFGAVHELSLDEWIRREVCNTDRLEPRAEGRLVGPPVVFHGLAGNVPGLAIPGIAACLLARSVCLIRDSRRQPLLTSAFVDTLADHDPLLARMVVIAEWDATDLETERRILGRAARIEWYGTDATVKAVAARHLGKPVVTHGTRVSIGLVPMAAPVDAAVARCFAEDAAMYDGKGCLSPHWIIVEGGRERADRMAELIGVELAAIEKRWPRRKQDIDDESLRRAFIDSGELGHIRGSERILRGKHDAWCIRVRHEDPITLGPGLRCLSVRCCKNPTATATLLARSLVPLAAVGLAFTGDRVEDRSYHDMLAELGATWICPPGRMQEPPIWWRQDGRPRLRELLNVE